MTDVSIQMVNLDFNFPLKPLNEQLICETLKEIGTLLSNVSVDRLKDNPTLPISERLGDGETVPIRLAPIPTTSR